MSTRVITAREGMRFGMGIDSQTEGAYGEAIQFASVTTEQGGQTVTSNFRKIESQESLMEAMSLSVSASVRYGLSSGDAKMDFARQHAVNDYSVYLLLQASVQNPPRHMTAPRLTDRAAEIYARDPEEFRRTFGDCYVDEIYGGGEFFGLFIFHAHDESTKTSVSASINASVGGALAGGSISAAFKSSIEEISKSSSTEIKVIMSGGAGLVNPRGIDELSEVYHTFNQAVRDNPVDFRVGIKEFRYLPLPAGPSWGEVALRGEIIQTCGRNIIEGIKQRSKVEYALKYPTEFAPFDRAAMRSTLETLDGLMPQWAVRAQECARDVARCTLAGIEPVEINLPTRLVNADPLAAKLEYVQHHDSRARDYFSESFLAGSPLSDYDEYKGGRYKLFVGNGAPGGGIFWHPEIDGGNAHVVYGSIFQEYLRRGHCRGPLGYPTGDEDTYDGYNKDGVDRVSYFQNGMLLWDAQTGTVTDQHPLEPAQRIGGSSRRAIEDITQPLHR